MLLCLLFFFLFLFLGLSLCECDDEDAEEDGELLRCLPLLCELFLGLFLGRDELEEDLKEDDEVYFFLFFLSLTSEDREELEDVESRVALLRRLVGLLPREEAVVEMSLQNHSPQCYTATD